MMFIFGARKKKKKEIAEKEKNIPKSFGNNAYKNFFS